MATIIQILQNTLSSIDSLLANEIKRIHLKEVLQSLVLDYVYNHPTYRGLNFYGGTCLHVIYDLNRLSEDIDLDNSGGVKLDHFADDLSDHFQKVLDCRDMASRSPGGRSLLEMQLILMRRVAITGASEADPRADHREMLLCRAKSGSAPPRS